MPVPTPEALAAALLLHPSVGTACRALGTTKQAVYGRRLDGYTHPELVAVCQAHAAAGKLERGPGRKAGEHRLALPPETVARLDALAAAGAAVVGKRRSTRSSVARQILETALRGPLPPPKAGERAMDVSLDLGDVWDRLGAAAGTDDPQRTSSLAYRWIQKEPRKEGAIWTIYQRETAADPWTVERRYVIRGARAVRHETPPVPPAVRRISDVPTAPPGFLGKRGRELGEAQDGLHVVRLAEYAFPDGSVVPYAELHETHDGQYPGRVMALSVLVHLAQNVGASEVWEINNREGPPEETDTPAQRFSALVAEALTRPGAPTQRALAVAVGLDEGNLSAWLAGRRTIPVRAIEAMFARLGILPR